MKVSLKEFNQQKERGRSVQQVVQDALKDKQMTEKDSVLIFTQCGEDIEIEYSFESKVQLLGAIEYLKTVLLG